MGDQETSFHKVTVDGHGYTGAENAIYAPSPRIVFVAYKRFLRDPYDPGGDNVPAQLRVAKSSDRGRHWSLDVVDVDAAEGGDLVEQSVAIDGDRAGTIYVAYLVVGGAGAEDASLRVAKSDDGGATWTSSRVARNVSGYVSMKVVDTDNVLIVARGAGEGEPLRFFATTNGGGSWDKSLVDTFGWHTAIDTSRSGRTWTSYYHPGLTNLHGATTKTPPGSWTRTVIAGEGDDNDFTGLGSSLDVTRLNHVYVSYEDFQQSRGRSLVRVTKSLDGGATWSTSRIQAGTYIGWNTAIHVVSNPAPAPTDIFVAYWYGRPGPPIKGRIRLAHGEEGEDAWSVLTVPERRYADVYLDLAAPSSNVQYVSYQAREGGKTILRVARTNATR